MSDIKPGDVVMLVYGCCPHAVSFIGNQYVVEGVENGLAGCQVCGTDTTKGLHAWIRKCGEPTFVPLFWLRKLEPPSLTTEKREVAEA